jgi:hypothetical protein
VRLVECREISEGVLAGNVRVEHEEWCVVLPEDLLSQLQGTGCAQGLALDRDGDVDTELLLVLLGSVLVLLSPISAYGRKTNLGQVLLHNFRAIVHGQDDVGNTSRGESLDLVQDHALVAELDEGFRQGQGL